MPLRPQSSPASTPCRSLAACLAAALAAWPPATAAAQPAATVDGLYTGTMVQTWHHPEVRCPWASPDPVLRIAEGRAVLRFHHDPPWEATGRVEPGGRMRLEFGRGTEIDVEVVGAVEGTAFRGVLRTRNCAFEIELVRRAEPDARAGPAPVQRR